MEELTKRRTSTPLFSRNDSLFQLFFFLCFVSFFVPEMDGVICSRCIGAWWERFPAETQAHMTLCVEHSDGDPSRQCPIQMGWISPSISGKPCCYKEKKK